jgi:hypothetical protein
MQHKRDYSDLDEGRFKQISDISEQNEEKKEVHGTKSKK